MKCKSIKLPLKSIIKKKEYLPLIEEKVLSHSRIVQESLHFLKLYFLYLFEKKESFPDVNRGLITNIFKIISKKPKVGSNPSKGSKIIKQKLQKFYDDEYSKTLEEDHSPPSAKN